MVRNVVKVCVMRWRTRCVWIWGDSSFRSCVVHSGARGGDAVPAGPEPGPSLRRRAHAHEAGLGAARAPPAAARELRHRRAERESSRVWVTGWEQGRVTWFSHQ